MIYDYKCNKCEHVFEVTKPVSEVTSKHECPLCGYFKTTRQFSSNIYFNGAKVKDAEYNHGLGCVVKSDRHRNEIAKRAELVEVGNEKPDTIHKETVVKKQEQRAKEWKDL